MTFRVSCNFNGFRNSKGLVTKGLRLHETLKDMLPKVSDYMKL